MCYKPYDIFYCWQSLSDSEPWYTAINLTMFQWLIFQNMHCHWLPISIHAETHGLDLSSPTSVLAWSVFGAFLSLIWNKRPSLQAQLHSGILKREILSMKPQFSVLKRNYLVYFDLVALTNEGLFKIHLPKPPSSPEQPFFSIYSFLKQVSMHFLHYLPLVNPAF